MPECAAAVLPAMRLITAGITRIQECSLPVATPLPGRKPIHRHRHDNRCGSARLFVSPTR